MSKEETSSNVIKTIINDIIRECGRHGEIVDETLASFMVKSVVLDPTNGFSVEQTFNKNDVRKLILASVQRLLEKNSIGLDTIKMQACFDTRYVNQEEFLQEHRNVTQNKLSSVLREITDCRPRIVSEFETCYKKIVTYILLKSGVGAPTNMNTVRETSAALESVFPQSELGTFVSLPKKDKETHLKDLSQLISGISLFNKECGKGGEGIDNIPPFLKSELDGMAEKLTREGAALNAFAEQIVKGLEEIGEVKDQDDFSEKSVHHRIFTEALINARQSGGLFKVILGDVLRARQTVSNLESKFQGHIESLKESVKSKTAVPTEQVFPHFAALAMLWSNFQDEMFVISLRADVIVKLLGFTKMAKGQGEGKMKDEDVYTTVQEMWKEAQESAENSSDVIDLTDNIESAADMKSSSSAKDKIDPESVAPLRVIFQESTPNFRSLVLQFNGYCAWTLAARDRMLLPGRPSIGLVEFREQYFTFINKKAAMEFAKDPDGYIGQIVNLAKQTPELINLCNLHSHFAAITPYHSSRGDTKLKVHNVSKRDNGIQTEIHPVESNLVKDYDWNEWELRRKAIKLANLRQKKTISMQTNLSHFRRESFTQHYAPKDQAVNTRKDGKSKVPKRANYIVGLRGKSQKAEVVDLTLKFEQDVILS
eukprot:Nk52_evm25s2118 gene=Nk52_evmTU25s2118